MTKDKKYTASSRKPLMTKPADMYYDGKKVEFKESLIYNHVDSISNSI
ncbi:hypothetical protein [Psychroflexus tropicus]|nr:hypothetical protein [Psychroflexus tropicus]